MGEPHILTTLCSKHEEIDAAIAAFEAKLETARRDLASLNRALALFEMGLGDGLIAPYFELGRLWKPGEIARVCVAALEREGSLDTEQMAQRVGAARGLDLADERIRKLLVYRVARALSRGKVGPAEKRDGIRVWSEGKGCASNS
jgi:hypothetical protein